MSATELLLILVLFAFLFGYERTWRGVKKLGNRLEKMLFGLYRGARTFQREIFKRWQL